MKTLRALSVVLIAVATCLAQNRASQVYAETLVITEVESTYTKVLSLNVPQGAQFIQVTAQAQGDGIVTCQLRDKLHLPSLTSGAVSAWLNIAGAGNGGEVVIQAKLNLQTAGPVSLYCKAPNTAQIEAANMSALAVTQ